jgi:hypothetical protein
MYKRSQIEDAMWELLRSEGENRSTTKTRISRLLVADRGLGEKWPAPDFVDRHLS